MRHWFDTPRKKVIVLALVCWLVVLGAMEFISVPYVRLSPGPMFDVLGESDGTPVITYDRTLLVYKRGKAPARPHLKHD